MSDYMADSSSYSDQFIRQNRYENELNKSILSRSQNISTDLTIKTAEGDIVKLSTNSFYDFKALLYDNKGRVYSDSGMVTNQESYRTMALKSGENFTFSVKGHLNERELDDIEEIVGKIDNIVEHMKAGNMDKALENALTMGGFDTVSGFSADLSVKKSYKMVSESIYKTLTHTDESIREKVYEPVEQLADHHFKNLLKGRERQTDSVSAFLEQLRKH